MPEQEIQQLKRYCEDFAKFRENTEDGNGNNLHDIKNTFDYVRKYVTNQGLAETVFGQELAQKSEAAANVLSELWLCLKNLEDSINGFCDSQMRNNGQN